MHTESQNPYDAALSAKQLTFKRHFRTCHNATKAAEEAGYSEKSAHVTGCRLLKNTKVAAAIAWDDARDAQRLEITAERVLYEYACIAFSDIRTIQRVENGQVHVVDTENWRDDVAAGVASISTRETTNGIQTTVKLHDKQRALEALSKHLGLFKADNEQSEPRAEAPRCVVGIEERIQALLAPRAMPA